MDAGDLLPQSTTRLAGHVSFMTFRGLSGACVNPVTPTFIIVPCTGDRTDQDETDQSKPMSLGHGHFSIRPEIRRISDREMLAGSDPSGPAHPFSNPERIAGATVNSTAVVHKVHRPAWRRWREVSCDCAPGRRPRDSLQQKLQMKRSFPRRSTEPDVYALRPHTYYLNGKHEGGRLGEKS